MLAALAGELCASQATRQGAPETTRALERQRHLRRPFVPTAVADTAARQPAFPPRLTVMERQRHTRGRITQRLHILPRSRHLPRRSTDGSLTENPNRIGVRLWTDSSRSVRWTVSGPPAWKRRSSPRSLQPQDWRPAHQLPADASGMPKRHPPPLSPPPLAVTEGSRIENLNKTGVWLWTACADSP